MLLSTNTISKQLLPTIRSTTTAITLRQANFNRAFHASTANMVKKVFFDCEWTGPEITVDGSGKQTGIDKTDKGRPDRHRPPSSESMLR